MAVGEAVGQPLVLMVMMGIALMSHQDQWTKETLQHVGLLLLLEYRDVWTNHVSKRYYATKLVCGKHTVPQDHSLEFCAFFVGSEQTTIGGDIYTG